ncbi:hypothetical protein EST38_g9435 [Candolleomyces aberdarensis]|uniref:Xylanolytic transcriptional activator regulatory domain-containing protein n=1 Tax=Candolleomyces aberdarensis TaxID=2316362 RepID=A0A4Q2D9X4_9AGAR|nr:hypothetical protein EST38_g9435 [Candolleomyces aberdarensis]
MPALIKVGAISPIDLTVAGIRVHVNRRGQDDGGVLHDEEDLADIRELCNKLSLDDELHEEALDIHKHYLGKSSGRHLLRTIIEMKERHRQDFESNSDVTTPTDTETESDYETDSTNKIEKAPQKIPFLGSRRPVYWKILPWEMTLFRSRPTRQSPEFPEPDLLHALVGYYFKHINIELPLLHRPTFEKEIAQGLHKRNATFGAVVLLVCAMGSRYSSDPRVQLSETDLFPDADGRPSDGDGTNSEADEEMRRRRRPSLAAYSRGWKYFYQAWEFQESLSVFAPPNLYDLYFYCLAAQYLLRGTSVPQAAWQLIGIGIRHAQEVGAHRKRSPKEVPVDKDLLKLDELWKRACWVLISIDRLLSSATGRPCALHDEDFDLELPIECDDEYWDDPNSELRLKQPEGKPSLITAFTLSIRFNQILDISMRTIYSIDKSKVLMGLLYEWEHRVVSEIDSALNKWLDTIPPHLHWGTEQPNEDFFLQSAILHSTYYYLQILVHRPFIPLPKKPSTSSFPSLTICTNAARKIIQIGLAVMERMDVVPSYTPLHLLSAAVILLLRIWESQKTETLTEQQYKKDMEGVNSCLKILKVAEKMSLSCGRLWDILYNLVMVNEMYVRPNLVKRTIQKSKKGKEDPARTRTRQESSKMTTLPPPPIYPPSPFTDPSVPLALDPETGLLLAGFRSGPQHLSSDGAHSTAAGSGSSSSTSPSFNSFSSAVPPVNVTTADPDTQAVPSTSSGAPIRAGASAPEWSAFAVPPETPQQSYLNTPFLDGFDSRDLRPSDRPGGSSPSPGGAAGLFDDGPQPRVFEAGLQPQQQDGSDLSGSLVFPMFGQDGNWNFAPMTEDVDMSNGLYSSIWAESVNVNTAP